MIGLDTTFLIDMLRQDKNAALKTIEIESQPLLATTEINIYELNVGLRKAVSHTGGRKEIDMLIGRLVILPLDHKATQESSQIAIELLQSGRMIDDLDCLIAGILLSNGYETILTRNIRHFNRIPGLKVETY